MTHHHHRWLALTAVATGTSLVIMDATIANVALPVIIRDLSLSATQAEWMNASYSLIFASLMLLSGRLGDLFGRKRFFIAGLTIFGLASLCAGLAPDGTLLIGARFVQGIGAAMVLPATLSSINALFTGHERNIAFAVYGSAIGGMAAVGPLVGGWLATSVDWRWAFWLNVPFILVVTTLAARYLPETRDSSLQHGIDIPGTLLATTGLGSIVFALIEAINYGWLTQKDGAISPVIIAIIGGLILISAFVLVELRREARGKVVLAHLRLFMIPSFRYGTIAALIVSLAEFGMLFALPLVLQSAMGYSALGTGAIVLVLALGTFISSATIPQLTRRLGQRFVVRCGLILETLAIAGLALALPSSPWLIGGLLFGYGVGVGFATAQLTSVVLSDIDPALSGEASGIQTTGRQLGSALGIAMLGGLLISTLSSGTAARLDQANVPAAEAQHVVELIHDSVGAAIPQLAHDPATAHLASPVKEAMLHAARLTNGVAAGVLALGLIATLALPKSQHDRGKKNKPAERPHRRFLV